MQSKTIAIRRRQAVLTVMAVLMLVALPGGLWGQKPIIVKMATLAPEGSPWHQVLMEIRQDWRDITGNKVRLRIYAGGTVGDESDMVRKMRIGQLQAAALSAEGLSYINKGIYALSLPMLAKNYRELDWIRSQVDEELKARFESKGYRVLAWADVGWVYWFSREPARTPDDMRKQRIFTWAGDPHSPRLWKAAGFQPVSLAAVDVLPALETRLIDAVDASPLMVASFQWFGTAKYMTDLPFAAMTGALIIKEEIWQSIPDKWRPKLQASIDKRTLRIWNEIRYSDAEAVEVMKKHGLTVISITAEETQLWQDVVDEFVILLRGTLVDSVMYDRVMSLKAIKDHPDFILP